MGYCYFYFDYDNEDIYATLKRPMPEYKTDKIYIFDKNFLCNPREEPDIYDINSVSFKMHVQNPPEQVDKMMKLPSSSSPILKKSTPTQVAPVTVTSTSIDAEDIFCIENKTLWSPNSKSRIVDTPPSTTTYRIVYTNLHKQRKRSGLPTTLTPRSRCHQKVN